jgi:transcriptional regulator with GAF, ATPase, and Fis domain
MLISIHEEGTRSELRLEQDTIRIGRALDNEIRLSSTLASRYHCRIERREDGVWLCDLGSANGTQVNGERIERRRLVEQDRIVVGGVRLVIESLEQAAQTVRLPAGLPPGLSTLTGDAREERENLHAFARITRELARESDTPALLRLIVDSALRLLKAERGFLLWNAKQVQGEEAVFEVRIARSFDGADIALPAARVSMGIARSVFRSGEGLLSVDASRDERFQAMASVEDLRLRSVLCAPIRREGRCAGVLYVDNRLQQGAFREPDLDLLALFADSAAIAIATQQRIEALRERTKLLEHSQRQVELLNEQLGRKVRDRDKELALVRNELAQERGRYDYSAIVGASEGMRRVFQQLDRITDSELPVLIHGESGTGKELIARAVHFNGARADKPFVSENCAALPDSLLESELFGYVKGAFTGAYKNKKGLFEQASGGTLFLDEIGDMSPEMQKKLLRVLQEGEVRPVGSDQRIPVDVRLVAASHRDLEAMVRAGQFREDLFYRIQVLPVRLPPLRERREDIPRLVEHLLTRAAREAGKDSPLVGQEVMAALVAYDWPGNVRELENEMRRLVVLARDHVELEQLSQTVRQRVPVMRGSVQPGSGLHGSGQRSGDNSAEATDIRSAVAELERRSIEAALLAAGGNKSRAASELGISRFALQRKLEKYGLAPRGEDGDGAQA